MGSIAVNASLAESHGHLQQVLPGDLLLLNEEYDLSNLGILGEGQRLDRGLRQ